MLQELSFALRRLAADTPASIAAALILALAVGFAGPLSGAVHQLVIVPLGYPDADRLVRIVGRSADSAAETNVSPPDFRDLRRASRTLAVLAAVSPFSPQLTRTGDDAPEVLTGRLASAGYFAAIGVPVVGREFTEADEQPSRRPVLVSERWWRGRLHERADVIGSVLMLNDQPHDVIGIVAGVEEVFGDADVWLPLQFPSEQIRDLRFIAVVARMLPGVKLSAVQEELRTVGAALQTRFPATNSRWMPAAVRLGESVAGPSRPAARLMAIVGVLLSASALISLSLLALAKGQQRSAEDRTRLALGATRWHLVRAMVLEQALLGAAGLVLAGVVSQWVRAALVNLAVLRGGEQLSEVVIAGAAVGLVLVMIAGSALVAGSSSGVPLLPGRGIVPGRSGRFELLVAVQVVVAVAGLALASSICSGARELRGARLGFDPAGTMFVRLHLPPRYAMRAERSGFWREFVARMNELRGIEGVALTSELPFTGQENATAFTATTRDRRSVQTHIRSVSPGYFALASIPLIDSEGALPSDDGAAHQVVINETLRRHAFGDGRALGETLEFNFVAPPFTARVSGIVGDVRHAGPAAAAQPEAYFAVGQTPLASYTVALRTRLDSAATHGTLRAVLQQLDKDVAVPVPQRWSSSVDARYQVYRWRAAVTTALALLVSSMAGIATYATARRAASCRRREYAIRVALGAEPQAAAATLVGRSLRICAAGAVAGVLAGYALIITVATRLDGIGSRPVRDGALALVIVALTTAAAAWHPAKSLLRAEPAALLRD